MIKYIAGAAVLIILIGGGWYYLKHRGSTASAPAPTSSMPMQAATSTYSTSTFSMIYPSDYNVDDTYTYDRVNPKKPISGVKFSIPGAMATGTNLAADTYLSVEWLPHAKNCTGDIYLAANVKSHALTDDNGTQYSLATSSEGAAGNFYEEWVYALSGSSPCTAVRYFIHSSDIGNYAPGAAAPFDRNALMSAFDTIRRSLTLGSSPAPAPATTP